jgi:hypothetical protein
MRYRYRGTSYEITVEQSPTSAHTGVSAITITLDGAPQSGGGIPLVDDGQTHQVRVDLRAAAKSAA